MSVCRGWELGEWEWEEECSECKVYYGMHESVQLAQE